MNTMKTGRPPIYAESLKIAIAREYLTSTLGSSALARKHGLGSEATVRHFVKWYKKRYPDGIVEGKALPTIAAAPVNIRELEKKLKEANLKIAGLEMLISVAKEELGIDILKKPGTKQSKK